MKGKDFRINPNQPLLADDLAKAIYAAADAQSMLVLEPGTYMLDAPVHVQLDHHQTRPWGIFGPGVSIESVFDTPQPLLTIEAIGSAAVRFLQIDGLGFRGSTALTQKGLVLVCHGTAAAIYRFNLSRLAFESCEDGLYLEGNVFEGDLCYLWAGDNMSGLALGNDLVSNGILSAINVVGGSFSQNKRDGIYTFGPQYREPYDLNLFGVYAGNNGRYSVFPQAGVQLMKGCRLENPWCDPGRWDPEGHAVRACVKLANFGVLEQCTGGGTGNATHLVDAYLADGLAMRECKIYSEYGLVQMMGKVDGQATGRPYVRAVDCIGGGFEVTPAVRLNETHG